MDITKLLFMEQFTLPPAMEKINYFPKSGQPI